MDLTEALLREVAQKVLGTTTLTYQGADDRPRRSRSTA